MAMSPAEKRAKELAAAKKAAKAAAKKTARAKATKAGAEGPKQSIPRIRTAIVSPSKPKPNTTARIISAPKSPSARAQSAAARARRKKK